MEMKDLNKSQLILLAILLSFVTSIATGITTVTLMEQAPTSFTLPVNRIVKQTVEKIQQVEGKTTVNTVVVKEEDLLVDALAKNETSIFSATKELTDEYGKVTEVAVGKALVVSSDGIVVVDGGYATDNTTNYYLKNQSGKFKADFLGLDKNGFAFLKIGAPVDEKSKVVFTVPTMGDLNKIKIGQKIIVYGNNISSYIFDGNKDLKVNVNKSNTGSPVIDLDGEVLGISFYSLDSQFVPLGVINEGLKAYTKNIITLPVANPA